MLGVVLSDQLIALFMFWELTSIDVVSADRQRRYEPAGSRRCAAGDLDHRDGRARPAGWADHHRPGVAYLSELIANPPSGSTVNVGVIGVLVGAFTSRHRHVQQLAPRCDGRIDTCDRLPALGDDGQAGVYLVSSAWRRCSPCRHWRWCVIVVGATTMLIGGLRACVSTTSSLLSRMARSVSSGS